MKKTNIKPVFRYVNNPVPPKTATSKQLELSEAFFRNDTTLDCFKVSAGAIRTRIPNCSSVTADIVNQTSSGLTMQQFEKLNQLRDECGPIINKLIELSDNKKFIERALNYNLTKMRSIEEQITQYTQQYAEIVSRMQSNGVLNCGEYATFTWLLIQNNNLLQSGYTAQYAIFKDPQIPEPGSEFYQAFQTPLNPQVIKEWENHDHAFVVITNISGQIEFVVDAWQSQISPHKTAFIGTVNEYVNFINRNPDGRYIQPKGVQSNHIRLMSEEIMITRMTTGYIRS